MGFCIDWSLHRVRVKIGVIIRVEIRVSVKIGSDKPS